MGDDNVTNWARTIFGDLAHDLARLIPPCLLRAHERARDGHQGVHTQTLEAYGHGLHAAQFEELHTGLAVLPGSDTVRLNSRSVVVISGRAFYPLRYAKRDEPVTRAKLRRAAGLQADLIRRHGPRPVQEELDLGLDELQEQQVHRDLTDLDPQMRLVLIAYACSMEQGIMRLEWGEAELLRGHRDLFWHRHEPLSLPRAA